MVGERGIMAVSMFQIMYFPSSRMQDSRQPMLAIRTSHVIAACQNKHGDAKCRDRKIDIKTLAED